ncbi:hypothetical protein ACOBR2_10230 [Telmatobacter bradus]|uniref:hypothetical protein n=1 Tax=Telmatobacter bradus TaxID=474953 RepID=UPI003B42E2D1
MTVSRASMLVAPMAASVQEFSVPQNIRRRIDPRAGRALEILGHAIEYLTDEYVCETGSMQAPNGELDAVHLLMSLNRQIYAECPVQPTLEEKMLALVGLRTA